MISYVRMARGLAVYNMMILHSQITWSTYPFVRLADATVKRMQDHWCESIGTGDLFDSINEAFDDVGLNKWKGDIPL